MDVVPIAMQSLTHLRSRVSIDLFVPLDRSYEPRRFRVWTSLISVQIILAKA